MALPRGTMLVRRAREGESRRKDGGVRRPFRASEIDLARLLPGAVSPQGRTETQKWGSAGAISSLADRPRTAARWCGEPTRATRGPKMAQSRSHFQLPATS